MFFSAEKEEEEEEEEAPGSLEFVEQIIVSSSDKFQQSKRYALKVPQIQFLDRLPAVLTVQKTVEIPQVQALFAGSVLKTVEVPQLQHFAKVFDVPGVQVVPLCQLLEVTVVIPQFQLVEKIRTCSWTMSLTCPLVCNDWWSMSWLRLSTWVRGSSLTRLLTCPLACRQVHGFDCVGKTVVYPQLQLIDKVLTPRFDELRDGFSGPCT